MPPSTTTTSSATPQMSRSARSRSAQVERSAAGPAEGSRQVIQLTATIISAAHIRPGSTPAAKSLPMLVSVTMP